MLWGPQCLGTKGGLYELERGVLPEADVMDALGLYTGTFLSAHQNYSTVSLPAVNIHPFVGPALEGDVQFAY